MTEQQLRLCSMCTNRRIDAEQGMVCSLTGQKPTYEVECPDFLKDESVAEVTVAKEPISAENLSGAVSADVYERLRMQQNLLLGIGVGVVVGLIGAILWGVITVATKYQIGYMAVAIGAGVGYGIRYFGKGIDKIFGISGAVIAVLSCVLGNIFSIIGFAAQSEGLGYIETLTMIDYGVLPQVMAESFGLMDIVFYGIAIYEGYKFSFRIITEEDIRVVSERM